MPNHLSSGLWFYEPSIIAGNLKYIVFDGTDPEPIYVLRIESNAHRLVDSANKTGHPDLAICADDERGITSP